MHTVFPSQRVLEARHSRQANFTGGTANFFLTGFAAELEVFALLVRALSRSRSTRSMNNEWAGPAGIGMLKSIFLEKERRCMMID